MTIGTIEVGQAEGNDLTVTLRGNATEIMKVLVDGLPREALVQLGDAITRELDVRRIGAANNPKPTTR